jgi:hypothetical protein
VDFRIAPEEQGLITAALALGDWLVQQREAGRKERRIIGEVQQALRALPAVPKVRAEYGFQLRSLNGKGLLYRAWRVSLSAAGLEIYSVYSPDQKIELIEKMSHELNFWIKPGETSGHDGHYRDQWIAEVSNPSQLRPGAIEFGVYAAYYD